MKKYLPVFLIAPIIFFACKGKLVEWKVLEIKYKVSGIAEGLIVERLMDHGWVWEMESELTGGDGRNYIQGKVFSHIDYYRGYGYNVVNGVKREIPESVFKKANRKRVRKSADFPGLLRIYKKLGFVIKGREKYLGRDCVILTKKGPFKEVIYLWEKLPFNMPLYHYEERINGFVEKKAVEIREEK